MQISWLHNGVPLIGDTYLSIRKHDDFSSNLMLSPVQKEHAGNYTCLARNDAREARYTAELLVRGKILIQNDSVVKNLPPSRILQKHQAQKH